MTGLLLGIQLLPIKKKTKKKQWWWWCWWWGHWPWVKSVWKVQLQLTWKGISLKTTGAPNDGLLQNTLKTLFRLSRVFLDIYWEIHSKQRYKDFFCSLILGELESFSENFRCNLTFYESENFCDSSLHHILESENFRFPFSTKTRRTSAWTRPSFSS